MSNNIMTDKEILIIGSGPMACAYAKVLNHMRISFKCIGRSIASANNFEKETGIKPITGGLASYLNSTKLPLNTYAIITTNTDSLTNNLASLIDAGAEKILVEKPGALSIDELLENEVKFEGYHERIFIAYNRRFYASVLEAQKLINEDGGLKSMLFEFTEWSHVIEPLVKAPGIKENWFFANSTHVVDLAFFFAGRPIDWKAYSRSGEIKWHEKTNFVGSGITERGVLFSYLSNWESAGRWAIELLTSKRRIYLKPLEGINIQTKGSIRIEEHLFDGALDLQFKPGVYKQVEAFLNDSERLLNIAEHIKNCKEIYNPMLSI